ncbi:MAG: hypothetical protein DCC49_09845, partial [Acidobacteria bacterium]
MIPTVLLGLLGLMLPGVASTPATAATPMVVTTVAVDGWASDVAVNTVTNRTYVTLEPYSG